MFVSRQLKRLMFCFNGKKKSPYRLGYKDQFGYGVFATRDITAKEDFSLLNGLAQMNLEDKDWFSQVEIKRGSIKYDLPLLGPVNFINHGCREHSTVNIFETNHKKYRFGSNFFEYKKKDKDKVITVKVIEIKKDDEILWPYGFTGCDKMKCVACTMEKQENRKIVYGVRNIETNDKRKKRDGKDQANNNRKKRMA